MKPDDKIDEIAKSISEDIKTTATKVYEVTLQVVYTPSGEVHAVESKTEPVAETIENAITAVRERLQKTLPDDVACSLIVADRLGVVKVAEDLPYLLTD